MSALLLSASCCSVAQIVPDGHVARQTLGSADVCFFTVGSQPTMTVESDVETTFVWTYAPDEATESSAIAEHPGATTDNLKVTKPGKYTVSYADKAYTQWWLSPTPEHVSFAIDSVTCDAIYAHIDSVLAPDVTLGGQSIQQVLTYEWGKSDSTLVTTRMRKVDFDGVYDPSPIVVKVSNQWYNTAQATDSVFPVAVKASFTFTRRERDIPNEATVSGESFSSPAEVEFTNKSCGNVNVSEWLLGTNIRLYDESPVYQFQEPGTYTIHLTVTNEEYGCVSVDSSATITISEAAIEFPNAFTPNGDGTNDLFLPAYRSLKSYELTIYNRWGREVFHSTDPTVGWDGKNNGREAAAGVYYFVSYSEGYEKGVSFWRKGSITLIR